MGDRDSLQEEIVALVLDSYPVRRSAIIALLQSMGWTVRDFENGRAVLKYLDGEGISSPLGLLILELDAPGISALALLDVTAHPDVLSLPLVFFGSDRATNTRAQERVRLWAHPELHFVVEADPILREVRTVITALGLGPRRHFPPELEERGKASAVETWLALPEVDVPSGRSPVARGTKLEVLHCQTFTTTLATCREVGLTGFSPGSEGNVVLATVMVRRDGVIEMRRLPMGLVPWAIEQVGLTRHGHRIFPAEVEFVRFEGDYLAWIRPLDSDQVGSEPK